MKLGVSAGSISLLVAAAAVAAAVPFAITLPTGFQDFTNQVQKATSPQGVIETSKWIARAPDGQAVIVSISHMPGPILNPDTLIVSTRNALAKSIKANVEREEKIAGSASARRVFMHGNGAFLRLRLFTTGDRLVQLVYVARSENQRGSAAVDQMFGSFALAP